MQIKTHSQGFTLIELMIVLAIIAVLAAVVLPAYKQYLISTNRADVQAELIQIAQRIQSYKITQGTYTGVDLSEPSIYGSAVFPSTGKALYNVRLNTTASAEGLITDWTLQATPITDTVQEDNGMVRLNDLGHKCWEKAQTTCTLSANSNWSEK